MINDKFFTIEKLSRRLNDLRTRRYRDSLSINAFQLREEAADNPQTSPPDPSEPAREVRLGEHWTGVDCYFWLSATCDVPGAWANRRVVALLDLGTGVLTNTAGFEGLLHVDGRPWHGVDTRHQEVLLPADAAGHALRLDVRVWSGLDGVPFRGGEVYDQHLLRRAEIAWIDEDVDDFYYWAKALLDSASLLADSSVDRLHYLEWLDRSLKLVDWAEGTAPAFYQSVACARAELASALAGARASHPVRVHCVGSTHIDVAWLWRVRHTREKVARSCATALRLMERFPEFIFLFTQPQLYAFLKSDHPDLYAEIKAWIREGRWEAGGAMWLEADCNLVSGESLVRQLLHGQAFLRREFGSICDYLWLPDAFGYSAALPQILQKSGIKVFMTTKISWNQYNRLPHDTFWWRGIDGSRVLTHFITTPDVETGSPCHTYNGTITAATVQGLWEAYQDKAINKELLLAYGYGDGGGGVTRDMLEMRRRLSRLPGAFEVETTRADDFFHALHERISSHKGYVHTWDGELYLELHRGTYTSQARTKRSNRQLELMLREAEWLWTTACGARGDWSVYPQAKLEQAWMLLLRNQFHDIIPGTSIREVYEDTVLEHEEAAALGRSLLTEGQQCFSEPAPGQFVVFNSAPWPRSELVSITADLPKAGIWTDPRGKILVAQCCAKGWKVQVEAAPPLGQLQLHFSPSAADAFAAPLAPAFTYSAGGALETPLHLVEWNASGQIVRLYDRVARREVLAPGAAANALQVFENKPLRGDAWGIELYYLEKCRLVTNLVSREVIECGPLLTTVRFKWTFQRSSIEQDVTFHATSPRIDFETRVDWREQEQLLKVAFPVDVRAREATYDIQFGNLKRPTHWNTSWDFARFEVVGHQWADLSENGYGVSLLNDCKYGYDIRDNVLRLSLINSPVFPDLQADQGEHHFTYSLLPHAGDCFSGRASQEAWSLNQPLMVAVDRRLAFSTGELFHIDSDQVQVDAVKKAEEEDAIILRLHEYCGGRSRVRISSSLRVLSWTECDLMERASGPETVGAPLVFKIAPYEIKTIRVRLEGGPLGGRG